MSSRETGEVQTLSLHVQNQINANSVQINYEPFTSGDNLISDAAALGMQLSVGAYLESRNYAKVRISRYEVIGCYKSIQ